MVEQRTIIDHKLHHILMHPEWTLNKREEYVLSPIEIDGHYFAPNIPNTLGIPPIAVQRDSNIKVVFFNRNYSK